MKIKTTWKNFWHKLFPERTLEQIWNDYEKGYSMPNAELRQIIEVLKQRNLLAIQEVVRLNDVIVQNQTGFDYSQRLLIKKLNSQQ